MTARTDDEQFTAAALRRIYIGIAVLGVAGAAGLLLWKGWWFGAGFAAGAALSYLNFHWLKGAVDALAAHFGGQGPGTGGRGAVPRRAAARLVLRYALLGVVGYVIFRTSALSLTAFLAGLFVFVAAVLAEMIYELTLGIPHA